MFDWSDLRYFLAVAREGSTLAAAKVLHVNQSTVHRRLAELERRLRCTLVERRATGYRLTECGKELQPLAESVEEAASALERHVAAFEKGMRGTVRLTCSTIVAHRLMGAKLLDAFHARYPGIRVELLMTERVLDLSKDEADVAIRGGGSTDNSLVGRKIADVPWGIYASRSYIERRGRPTHLEDINEHSVIAFIGQIGVLKAAGWLQAKAPRATISGQATNVPSVLMAVKSGVGLAPLPAPVAELEGDLVRLMGPIPELAYPTYLFTHRDLRKIPRVSAFFDYCLTELKPVLSGSAMRKNVP